MQDREFRELIERIKLRTPIEGVVGERVPDLARRGSAWKACCPFHDEKTPSFVVNPERGTWHCFGACQEGGDVIAFVQRFEGLTFLEALRVLAHACGEEIPERDRSFGGKDAKARKAEEEARGRLFDVIERAQRLYARALYAEEGTAALRYARDRGLTDETLQAFGVGFAPRGNPLREAATKSGVSEQVLIDSGLARRSDDGSLYDFFRGRWMIPIRDQVGRTVGFGGRTLPGDDANAAKYVNTGETALFKKSRLIYGLDLALPTVRRTKHLVLMEGYTDVMAAHQVGIKNTAAVLGTATTADHAALVRRSGAKRVTLIFDGDDAGLRAGLRAIEHLLPLGLRLEVVALPAGTDPCDLCIQEGAEGLQKHLDEARDWYEHALSLLQGLSGPELALEVDELLKLLLVLPKRVERDVRVSEMARFLGIPEEGIREQGRELSRRLRGRRTPAPRTAAPGESPDRVGGVGGPGGVDARDGHDSDLPEEPSVDPRRLAMFESLVGAALVDPTLLPQIRARRDDCPEGAVAAIFDALLVLWDEGEEDVPIDEAQVISALGPDPARDRVMPLAALARTAESPQAIVRDQLALLARDKSEAAVHRETRAVANGADLDDPETRAALERLQAELRGMKVPQESAAEAPRSTNESLPSPTTP